MLEVVDGPTPVTVKLYRQDGGTVVEAGATAPINSHTGLDPIDLLNDVRFRVALERPPDGHGRSITTADCVG